MGITLFNIIYNFSCSTFGEFIPSFKGWYITNVNIMLTMLLEFMAWSKLEFCSLGGLNGLGIVIYKIWRKLNGGIGLGILITFYFVSFTRIWFRSGSTNSWEDMDSGHNILSEWFTANEMLYQLIFDFRWALISDVVSAYYRCYWSF